MNRRQLLGLLAAGPLAACSADQRLVPVASRALDTQAIDAEPLKLLPSEPLFVGRLDAGALFRSPLGPHVEQILTTLMPLGSGSGFSASRDVHTIWGAAYAMQGADVAAVLQGSFNVTAMEQASQAIARTPSTMPLVETGYGGHAIYTVGNLGYCILTPATVITGSETAIRRAIDRLHYGEVDRPYPAWMLELFADQRAAFAVAGDVRKQGSITAAQERLPFVDGLQLIRALGNFETPGLNIVGSLSYRDEQTAAQGAVTLRETRKLAYTLTLMANLGVGGGNVPELVTQHQGTHVAFASSVDTELTTLILSVLNKLLRPDSTGLF